MAHESELLPTSGDLYDPVTAKPLLGLVIHEVPARSPYPGHQDHEVVTTIHPMQTDDHGGTMFGAGRPLTPDEHAEVVQQLSQGAGQGLAAGGFIPNELLYATAESAVWYIPAAKRPMHFRVRNDERGSCVVTVKWPALVCCARRSGLAVAALARNARPQPDTPLYHAPLMNIWSDTWMCLGQVRPPEGRPSAALREWESALFDTAFSHVNHSETLRVGDGSSAGLLDYWHSRSEDGRAPYKREMVPLNLTLAEWYERVLDGKSDDA